MTTDPRPTSHPRCQCGERRDPGLHLDDRPCLRRAMRVRIRRSFLTGDFGDLSGRFATVRKRSPLTGTPRVMVDVDGLPDDCPFYLLPSDVEIVNA